MCKSNVLIRCLLSWSRFARKEKKLIVHNLELFSFDFYFFAETFELFLTFFNDLLKMDQMVWHVFH